MYCRLYIFSVAGFLVWFGWVVCGSFGKTTPAQHAKHIHTPIHTTHTNHTHAHTHARSTLALHPCAHSTHTHTHAAGKTTIHAHTLTRTRMYTNTAAEAQRPHHFRRSSVYCMNGMVASSQPVCLSVHVSSHQQPVPSGRTTTDNRNNTPTDGVVANTQPATQHGTNSNNRQAIQTDPARKGSNEHRVHASQQCQHPPNNNSDSHNTSENARTRTKQSPNKQVQLASDIGLSILKAGGNAADAAVATAAALNLTQPTSTGRACVCVVDLFVWLFSWARGMSLCVCVCERCGCVDL